LFPFFALRAFIDQITEYREYRGHGQHYQKDFQT